MSAQLEWASTAPLAARHVVDAWLDGVGCSDHAKADAVLVVSELVTHAVNRCLGAPRLEAALDDDLLHVRVISSTMFDAGSGREPYGDLGTTIVTAICHEWGVERGPAETRHWAAIRC